MLRRGTWFSFCIFIIGVSGISKLPVASASEAPLCFVVSGLKKDWNGAFEGSSYLQSEPAEVNGEPCRVVDSWQEVEAALSARSDHRSVLVIQAAHGGWGGYALQNSGNIYAPELLGTWSRISVQRRLAVVTDSCYSADILPTFVEDQAHWSDTSIRNFCLLTASTLDAISRGETVKPREFCEGCSMEEVFLSTRKGLLSSYPFEGTQFQETLMNSTAIFLSQKTYPLMGDVFRQVLSGTQSLRSSSVDFYEGYSSGCDVALLKRDVGRLEAVENELRALEGGQTDLSVRLWNRLMKKYSEGMRNDCAVKVMYELARDAGQSQVSWGVTADRFFGVERDVHRGGCESVHLPAQLAEVLPPENETEREEMATLVERLTQIQNLRYQRLQILESGHGRKECRLREFLVRLGMELGRLGTVDTHPEMFTKMMDGRVLRESNYDLFEHFREVIQNKSAPRSRNDLLRREACQSFRF